MRVSLPPAADEGRGAAVAAVEGGGRPEGGGAGAPPELRGHGRRRGHGQGVDEPPQPAPASSAEPSRSPAAATEAAGRRVGQPRLWAGGGARGHQQAAVPSGPASRRAA